MDHVKPVYTSLWGAATVTGEGLCACMSIIVLLKDFEFPKVTGQTSIIRLTADVGMQKQQHGHINSRSGQRSLKEAHFTSAVCVFSLLKLHAYRKNTASQKRFLHIFFYDRPNDLYTHQQPVNQDLRLAATLLCVFVL